MEYHNIIEKHLVFVRIMLNFLYLYNLIFVPILNVLIDKCQDKIIRYHFPNLKIFNFIIYIAYFYIFN